MHQDARPALRLAPGSGTDYLSNLDNPRIRLDHISMQTEHRKKLKRYEIAEQPRFLTFSCFQRLPLFMNDTIKDRFLDNLSAIRNAHHFRLCAGVIMPEHVHLILIPQLPEFPVAPMLNKLKGDFARAVMKQWKILDAPILSRLRTENGKYHFWQSGGGYDRNVRDDEEFFEKIDYIHANPVKRGLVEQQTDWKWSSARWYAGIKDSGMKID